MDIVRRRRAATLAVLASAAAVLLTALPLTSAQAAVGVVTAASPAAASNASVATGASCQAGQELVVFTTTSPFAQGGQPPTPAGEPGQGTQIELVRSDTDPTLTSRERGEDVIIGNVLELSQQTEMEDPRKTGACFRFGPGAAGTATPANPGRYNVYVFVEDRQAGDACTGCFSVFGGAPTVTAVRPASLPAGVQGQVFAVQGTSFAKSTSLEFLVPGTESVDPRITLTAATEPLVQGQIPLPIANTSTKISRTIRVDPAAAPGFRDVRLINTDRQSVIVPNGLRITDLNVDRIDPNASGNDAKVRLTITGRGIGVGAIPSLVNEAATPAAVIPGTDVQPAVDGLVADFDLTGAAPGEYRVRVANPDGSASTPECSPVYTVVETRAGSAGRAVLAPSEFTCSPASTSTSAPSPSSTGTASPRPSTSSSPRASATPTATMSNAEAATGSRYRGLESPVRVLDTRSDNGSRRSGGIVVELAGQLNDSGATAVVLNVTVTNPTARGFLVAYPDGATKPGTSNVNFDTGQTQANEVVVGLSQGKRIALFVDSAEAHVIVDLVGSFTRTATPEAGRVVAFEPVRALDTRTTSTPRRTGEVVVDLSGRLPRGSTDVVLNVTVQGPDARGFVVAHPTGVTRPGTSNVNFERGQTQANEVVTRVGTGDNAGRVSLFLDSSTAALIVDVVGAVTPGSTTGSQTFTALQQPSRALDTRVDGSRRSGEITAAVPSTVPSNATGVVLNVTATNGTGPGFLTVYPAGSANPGTSNVNFPGERRATELSAASAGTQANEVLTRLGSNRSVTIFVGGRDGVASHVIVDVVGYLTE